MTGAGTAPERAAADHGSAAVELVLLVIPIMVLVSFAVFAGRYSATHQEVTSASRDAARAAAVRQLGAQARFDGEAAAAATLERRSVSCPSPDVEIEFFDASGAPTADPVPGGFVEATVSCTVGLADVVGFGMPGSRSVASTSSAVVDSYRGGAAR
jgi:Flp pilus assembly protein TadG